MGADVTDAQNAQNELVTKLSSLVDLKVATGSNGSVTLSTTGGATLVGPNGAATLAYTPNTGVSQVTVTQPSVGQTPANVNLASGEIQGLLTMRNTTLPGVANQLSQYVAGAVTAINAASNASTAVPAPSQLTGVATGVDLQTSIGDFSGATNVAIVDSSGNLQEQVAIDFTAGTMSVNGGAATAFTPATFLSSLNTALGADGSASFTNGALSIQATNSGDGVAIADNSTTPSAAGNGEGFSQYFGLNNLINSSGITNFNTGLNANDPSGFPAGQTLSLCVWATMARRSPMSR